MSKNKHSNKPAAEESVVVEPAAEESVVVEPAAEESVVVEPAAEESVVVDAVTNTIDGLLHDAALLAEQGYVGQAGFKLGGANILIELQNGTTRQRDLWNELREIVLRLEARSLRC